MVARDESLNLLLLHFHVLLLLSDGHDKAAVGCQLRLRLRLRQCLLIYHFVSPWWLRLTRLVPHVEVIATSGVLTRLRGALRRLGDTLRLIPHARAGAQLVDAASTPRGCRGLLVRIRRVPLVLIQI